MFHSPGLLTLLCLVPLLAWRLFARRRGEGVRFSSIDVARVIAPTLRQRLLWLPPALSLAALSLIIVGLARPREGREQAVAESEGIAIELVVDRSGSMEEPDFQIDGEYVDRLTAVKNVAGKFILGGERLAGRFNDLVGLVAFARFADGLSPPTLDHAYVVSQLAEMEIVQSESESGTAIGDGLALAVEKLNALDERREKKVASKVVVLLTDGENNVGELAPVEAAEIAAAMGIRVYTIGMASQGRPVRDPFTGRIMLRRPQHVDEETLQEIAATTGGKYFRATDTDSLLGVYREIDQLEKSQVDAKRYVNYRELAVQPYRRGAVYLPPVLWLAFVLLAARFVLEQTWLRKFP